jgi:hypothetical protein
MSNFDIDQCEDRIVIGGMDITDALKKEIRDEAQIDAAEGLKHQQAIAKFHSENRPRFIDGMGETILSVDVAMFHLCRNKFGEDCWSDPGFQDWVLKHFPEYRVKGKGKDCSLQVDGFKESA